MQLNCSVKLHLGVLHRDAVDLHFQPATAVATSATTAAVASTIAPAEPSASEPAAPAASEPAASIASAS